MPVDWRWGGPGAGPSHASCRGTGAEALADMRREYGRMGHALKQLDEDRAALAEQLAHRQKRQQAQQQEKVNLERSTQLLRDQLARHAVERDRLRRQSASLREAARRTEGRHEQLKAELHETWARVPGLAPASSAAASSSTVDDKEERSVGGPESQELRRILGSVMAPGDSRCCDGCGGPGVAGMLPLVAWSLAMCFVLDSTTDSTTHWLLFVAVHLLVPLWLWLQTQLIRMRARHALEEDGESDEDADDDAGESTQRLLAPGETLSLPPGRVDAAHASRSAVRAAKAVLAPCERLLEGHRHAAAPSAILALHQVVYLGLFALAYPQLCFWAGVRANGLTSIERGGQVMCPRNTFLNVADPGEVAALLALAMPALWAVAWHCQARAGARDAAQALLTFSSRFFQASIARQGEGAESTSLVKHRLQALASELYIRWMGARRATLALLLDALDAAELWRMVATSPQLIVPYVRGAPADTMPAFLLHTDEPAPSFAYVRLARNLILGLALGAMAIALLYIYAHALSERPAEVLVTPENRHEVFILFMRGRRGMPRSNLETMLRSLLSLVLVDLPFLAVRVGVVVVLRVGASPLAAKNAACLACHVHTVVRYIRWRWRVWRLLRRDGKALRALDARIFDISAGGSTGAAVYERIGDVYEVMGRPEAEFLALYHEDIGAACDAPRPPTSRDVPLRSSSDDDDEEVEEDLEAEDGGAEEEEDDDEEAGRSVWRNDVAPSKRWLDI
eukprot:gnl/TRDRNA2_/TRDRNA2_41919_c0_seq1.p1 gnl/TRDRNA2_/TRDRNA2_41919_c0~~gnl/TRDRNA2_/TRDRNA2_41919_c0_seq1.p1  ORF type:complete len:739 (-),score=141.97 gnl/TRDRNA2_/TRDRNA2_41919_c0_seq1:58-2274(-)